MGLVSRATISASPLIKKWRNEKLIDFLYNKYEKEFEEYEKNETKLINEISKKNIENKFKIRQHIPNWSDMKHKVAYADSIEEVPWIMSWKDHPEFFRFSVSRERNEICLMAELDEGYTWWVVGKLDRDISQLPTWEPKYEEEKEKPRFLEVSSDRE